MGATYDSYVDGSLTSLFSLTDDFAGLPASNPTIMMGTDSALDDIKDYLNASDKDCEKVSKIKNTIDPKNQLKAKEIIGIIDELLKKSGKKWNNDLVSQVLILVLTISSVKSFTDSFSKDGE